MTLPASASTLATNLCFNECKSVPFGRSTTGILAIAQPEAMVISALEHMTAFGAVP